jgi:hypothetical protein
LHGRHRFPLVIILLIGADIDRDIEIYTRGVIRHRSCDFGAECATDAGRDSADGAFPAFAKKHGHLSNRFALVPNHLPQNRARTVTPTSVAPPFAPRSPMRQYVLATTPGERASITCKGLAQRRRTYAEFQTCAGTSILLED